MINRDKQILERMLHYACLLPQMIDNIDYDAFAGNEEKMLAVTHAIAIIGELERSLSKECKERHNNIPWGEIRKTRNIIAHDYSSVDFDTIWSTVIYDIPALITELNKAIEEEQ